MAVSAPFAVEVSLVRGRERSHWYAACSRKPIFPITVERPDAPPLDYRPSPTSSPPRLSAGAWPE